MNVMTKARNDARRELNVRATKAARDVVMGAGCREIRSLRARGGMRCEPYRPHCRVLELDSMDDAGAASCGAASGVVWMIV